MNTLQDLDTLESKIKTLANKLHQLYEDNQKLKAKLVVERKEYDTQVLHWEEQLAAALSKANTANDEELNHKLQFQEQQIKLLETERINLRDQISFLQNTIQNKEKNWQERFTEQEQHGDKFKELQEQLQAAEDSVLVLRQELTSQKQQASETQNTLQQSNTELTDQLAVLQAQLSEAEHRIAQYDNETAQLRASLTDAQSERETQEKSLLHHVQAEKDALATQLAQEAERFRMEFALQTEQHEKSLNELNQMFNQQKEHLENENTQLQQQVEQLITQNHAYRALLQENANKIRALLDRLPALENNHEETIP